VATTAGNYGITGQQLDDWANVRTAELTPTVPADKDYLSNALILFLMTGGGTKPGNGKGSYSRVYFDPRRTATSMGQRPSYIGLGHELIHAYYNSLGGQWSHSEDSGHYSTTLYEYMRGGLGPFSTNAISENRLRAQANVALRNRYA